MNKPTEAQVKEFWEWCGWRCETKPYEASFHGDVKGEDFDVELWYSPDEPDEPQGLPPIDLNNLFRYAVPKLVEDGYSFGLETVLAEVAWYWWIIEKDDELWKADRPDPALALFWVIWAVIHKGGTG